MKSPGRVWGLRPQRPPRAKRQRKKNRSEAEGDYCGSDTATKGSLQSLQRSFLVPIIEFFVFRWYTVFSEVCDKLESDKDMVFMNLENAELKNIERIVAISKAAFDSDIDVGASELDRPPDYDSIAWHIQMKNEGHLLQAVIDGEIVGGAILFVDNDGQTLYVGRIFLDPVHYRKGYGLSLMKMVEAYYSGIKTIKLDTPLWNVRTNAFYTKLGYREVKRDEEFAYYQKEWD